MSGVAMVGFTHRGCALGALERVSVPHAAQVELLGAVRSAGFPEAVVLSTCSRTEIYVRRPAESGLDRLLDLLARRAGGWTPELRAAAETRDGQDAVRHLFRVVAGLDSRVVGEPEIRSQARAAFRQAYAAGAVGGALGELFPAALRAGSEVRRKTSVVSQARSLAHRAVDVGLAAGGLDDPRVLVLGSGRMAGAAVDRLRHLGCRPVVVARSLEHAARLVGGDAARPLEQLTVETARADLLISATAASQALVTAAQVARAMAGRTRPLTVVDLSVPRNVAPEVGDLHLVRLVDIEDLSADPAGDPGLGECLVHAEALVREAARRHVEHVAARRAGPLIAAMRRRVREVCLETLVRTTPSASHDELARQAHRVAGRLAHPATMLARSAASSGDEATLLVLSEAFGVPWSGTLLSERAAQSLTTTYDAAVELIRGLTSQPGGEIGRSSGAETRTTTRSVVASTANCRPG
jgi:glutamyl-tRNA reductase